MSLMLQNEPSHNIGPNLAHNFVFSLYVHMLHSHEQAVQLVPNSVFSQLQWLVGTASITCSLYHGSVSNSNFLLSLTF